MSKLIIGAIAGAALLVVLAGLYVQDQLRAMRGRPDA